jgi:hypothetical protein
MASANNCDGLLRDGVLRHPSRETEGLLRDQIDALVYELYGLTSEEIKIVEEKSQ